MKVLIIEDDVLIAKDIQAILEDWGYEVVGSARNYTQAIRFYEAQQPDLALVDIQIQGDLDGIEVVHHFNQQQRIPIIYLTAQADKQTVARAKETSPAAYLLKPFDERHLSISLELALSNFYDHHERVEREEEQPIFANQVKLSANMILKNGLEFYVKQKNRFIKLQLQEIYFVEADKNHSYIHTIDKKIVLRMSLSMVLERLDSLDLARVHRSYAVNIKKIEAFNETEIKIKSEIIPFSKAYQDDFLMHFKVI